MKCIKRSKLAEIRYAKEFRRPSPLLTKLVVAKGGVEQVVGVAPSVFGNFSAADVTGDKRKKNSRSARSGHRF
jgi:hypothetical protein